MYIPVLMYHDVGVKDSPSSSVSGRTMMPLYNISTAQFEAQMECLADMGFECPSLANKKKLNLDKKYVILTFDDGLIGNFVNVLPLLKKYGFFGNFFVTTGSIGTVRFMSWDQLRILVKEGMYVQSHAESHRSLEILDKNEIQLELAQSKIALEKELGVQVNGISFPHGSYNKDVVSIATGEGYNILCTSDVSWETYGSFQKNAVILGRFAITNKIDLLSFKKIINGSRTEYYKRKLLKLSKSYLKQVIGVQRYRKIYRYIYNIKKEAY